MSDISSFGTRVQLVASNTFPAGISLSQWADDADGVDIPPIQIGDKAMGVNGDIVTWKVAKPVDITLNVIPGSDDDKNLSVLAQANRVGRGKRSVKDVITLTVNYPDGSFATLDTGAIMSASFAKSFASTGKQKTKQYIFTFQGITGNF